MSRPIESRRILKPFLRKLPNWALKLYCIALLPALPFAALFGDESIQTLLSQWTCHIRTKYV